MDISVIIPAYNEERNVVELYERLTKIFKLIKKKYEIIFVDDGSTDNTFNNLEKITRKDNLLKIIKFRRNFGQSAAWDAGFKHSKGNLIITMDADLQNDPKDIPRLLTKLEEGYDVVSGWRYYRKDIFSKRLFSGFSRLLRRKIINDHIHDSGCALKVYKRDALLDVEMQGEMHRYVTEILALRGYKIGEVKISHYKRKYGKTKYNFLRVPKGFLDLLVVAFWQKYSARPVHLFGGAGVVMGMTGFLVGIYLIFVKFYYRVAIADRPLLLLSVLLVLLGIQFFIFGLMADVLVKLYYSGKKRNYYIEKIISK